MTLDTLTLDEGLLDSDETYDYEYSLSSGHPFFSKAYQKGFVIPNYIVVQSMADDDPSYSGYAEDTGSSDIREVRQYIQTKLTSNAQATSIATAILTKYQLNAQVGAAEVPMNVGAEVFDFIKVTDSREVNVRTGNIGSITRTYKSGKFSMSFSFGDWYNVRGLWSDLETYESGLGNLGQNLSRLEVKDLVVENIQADNINLVWMDSDGNIDLSLIGDDLDGLDDGTTYQRVQSAALSAAGLVLLDETVEGTYGLVLAADLSAGHLTFDAVLDGTTYKKVLATQISAGNLKLTSATLKDGTWYSESGVEIDATDGIGITGDGKLSFYVGETLIGRVMAATTIISLSAYANMKVRVAGDLGASVEANGDVDIDSITADVNINGATGINLETDAVTADLNPVSNSKDIGDVTRYDEVYCDHLHTTIGDYQSIDDLEILKNMKSLKQDPAKIDPTSLPDTFRVTKERFTGKAIMKAAQRKQRRLTRLTNAADGIERAIQDAEFEMDKARKDKGIPLHLTKQYSSHLGNRIKIKKALDNLDNLEKEEIEQASKRYDDYISTVVDIPECVGLALGAIRKLTARLEALESR
uniref:Uncharacterized protein n=1 Tax=viral metagenome TaxID=1070528 RepID=A0A6H1ZJK8_9ZZZZ